MMHGTTNINFNQVLSVFSDHLEIGFLVKNYYHVWELEVKPLLLEHIKSLAVLPLSRKPVAVDKRRVLS